MCSMEDQQYSSYELNTKKKQFFDNQKKYSVREGRINGSDATNADDPIINELIFRYSFVNLIQIAKYAAL